MVCVVGWSDVDSEAWLLCCGCSCSGVVLVEACKFVDDVAGELDEVYEAGEEELDWVCLVVHWLVRCK